MAHDDKSTQTVGQITEELSPVKRALVEIRRLRAELESCRRGQLGPVAIIGLAVRLPGGITSPEEFWKALAEGKDLITTVPPERWNAQAYWSPDGDQPGTMYDTHGGFLSDIDAFDADLFGIHPREAASMDPQHRLLLELTWEALERATIDPRSLKNTQTGIYLGLTNSDYGRLLIDTPRTIDGYTGVGAAASIAAGRLAYFLGTHGPALAIDTACSSSLVAVHQAVQSLRKGEIDVAIVGAANLILSPEMNVSFSRTRMLSRDGRCKTFDASADGYVRAEGCCVIVLKRLADAARDDDRVLAKIHGTAVNQDGRSAGITAPNGPAQEAVMRAALADAGVQPGEISYVEAHGTGTPLGDPMEVQAIGAVYGEGRSSAAPLRVGSVKTNLGHTEAAAGLTGLIKTLLMMQPGHGIAPNLHFKQPSPQMDWARWAIEIPVQLTAWGNEVTRYAGVSSFGFSGTNAHLIVGCPEEVGAPAAVRNDTDVTEEKEWLLRLSANNEAALRILAHQYVDYLRQTDENFRDICLTTAAGRAQLKHRLAVIAHNAKSAAELLESWLNGHAVAGVMTSADTLQPSQPDGGTEGLKRIQQEFVAGGAPPQADQFWQGARRRVALPLYPFQRQRYWFGDPPLVKQQKERAEAWQNARAAAQQQSLQGPLGWDLAHYPERWRALENLTRAHAQNFLAATGAFPDADPVTADDVIRRCGIQPIYLKLVRRWLSGLAQDGVLIQTGDTFRATGTFQPVSLNRFWQDAAGWMEDDPGALAYLKQCGALLGDVLTGRKGALETLFPDGSFALAEGLYKTSAQARYVNPIIASALHAAVQVSGRRRSVRILEVGGGTGGTTSAILPQLPSGKVEYWFTDLSELFLRRAQREFSQYESVRYRLFDVDREFEEQGFRDGMFDVVVAANVVHAARDLASALHRLQRLLSPGGILALLETTHHHSWFDMSTGLIEGWQHFEDEDRQEHPLLNPDQWRALLERSGFAEVISLPGADSPASALGQHVLLARRSEDESQSPCELPSLNTKAVSSPRPVQHLNSLVKEEFQGVPDEMREPMIATVVRETVCSLLRLDARPEELNDRDRLTDLGMDSLIALELRSELAKRLGLEGKISSTIGFDTGTVGELVRSLVPMLAKEADAPLPISDIRTKQRQHEPALVTEEQLQSMSEEEVELLLKERLARQ